MSEQIDSFTNALRDKLNDIDDRLSSVKMTIESASQETQATIEFKLKQVKAKLETKRQDFNAYRLELKRQAEEKQAEVKSKIDEWKTNRETEELNRRADRAEEYAASGIAVAMAAIDAGFQRHLAKPIDPTQLIWLVANLVGRVSEE